MSALGLLVVPGVSAQGGVPAASLSGTSWPGVRILDYQQWSYENVSLSWDRDGELLRVQRPDGATRWFKPEEILHVYAADGREITAEVAAARPDGFWSGIVQSAGGQVEVGATPSRTLEQLIRPPLYKVAFDLGYGYGITAGDWYWGMSNGENYHAGLRIMLEDNQYLRLAFRNQGLGAANSWPTLPVDESVRIEASLHEYQFLLGRHSPVEKQDSVRATGYMEFGLSAMVHRFAAGPVSDAVTKVGVVFQGGLWLLLSDAAALDFSAGFTWKPGFNSREAGGMVMGARLSLVVFN